MLIYKLFFFLFIMVGYSTAFGKDIKSKTDKNFIKSVNHTDPLKLKKDKCPECCKTRNTPAIIQETIVLNKKLKIEKIIIKGNKKTKTNFILKQLMIKRGEYISSDSQKLSNSRLKLISLGLFISVEFSFKKGSSKGNILLLIKVKERGTLLIKHIFAGSSKIIPVWLGAGVEEKNFLGIGLTAGFSGVVTSPAQIMDGKYQFGFDSYIFSPNYFSIPLRFGVNYKDGSEFYRIYGDNSDGNPSNFLSLHYKEVGSRLFTFFPVGSFFLHLGVSSSFVFTKLPSQAVRHYNDGTSQSIDFGLRDTISHIGLFHSKLVYDTRNRPILPSRGSYAELRLKLGSPFSLSKYTFLTGEIIYNKFFQLGKHVLSFHFYGGAISGDPPIFEKFYIGDVQDLVAQRALGLSLSVAPSPNFMNTGISVFRRGTAAFKVTTQYDYPIYSGKGIIYRGNIFISGGLMGLSSLSQRRYRDQSLWKSIPIDITFDFGVNLDTKVGIFRFTFSNALGRIPY